jgi:hypothetical protein
MGVDEPTLADTSDAGATTDDAAIDDPPPRPPCNGAPDDCPVGAYCAEGACTPGCKTDPECLQLSPTAPLCDLNRHQCVSCLNDTQCMAPMKCSPAGSCVPVCSAEGGTCPNGRTCCAGLCIDPQSDVLNCGACGTQCSKNRGAPSCVTGVCQWACADGFAHCAAGNTGCETDVSKDLKNCGTCGQTCKKEDNVAEVECKSGKCHIKTCDKYNGDCDGKFFNGCECPCGAKWSATAKRCCPGNICFDGHCSFGYCN